MFLVGRPLTDSSSDCPDTLLHYNDPTSVAVFALRIPYSKRLLLSFREAGGVGAVTPLVKETKRPVTVKYTAELIEALMESVRQHRDSKLPDRFFHSGVVAHHG